MKKMAKQDYVKCKIRTNNKPLPKNPIIPFIKPRKNGQTNKDWIIHNYHNCAGVCPSNFNVPDSFIEKFDSRLGTSTRMDYMVAFDFYNYVQYIVRNKLMEHSWKI